MSIKQHRYKNFYLAKI